MVKATAKCPKCQGSVEFGVAEQPSIINLETVSMAVAAHSGPVTCPGCLTKLVPFVVQAAGMLIGLGVLPEKNLVQVPGGGQDDNGYKG